MNNASDVRRSWAAEAMLALVPEGLRASVRRVKVEGQWVEVDDIREQRDPNVPPTGRDMVPLGFNTPLMPERALEVMPGQNALKPVIREIESGRVVAGSGRYPMANNIGAIGAATAYKRSKSYREAIESLIPFEDSDARFSVERLIDDAFDAAEGSPQTVRCPHCNKDGVVAFKKDGNLIFKLIELLVGKAPQTIEVKADISARLAEVMNARQDAKVIHMTREQWEARETRLIADGTIDPEWLEGEYKEIDPSEKGSVPE